MAVLKKVKSCSRCHEAKPLNKQHFPLHNRTKDGFDSWCRRCRSNYRSSTRRGKYRDLIDDESLENIVAVGVCTICGKPGNQVDHCHKTNKVRGLLCINCNQGLGKFQDDPELLEFARIYLLAAHDDPEALDYLERYQ